MISHKDYEWLIIISLTAASAITHSTPALIRDMTRNHVKEENSHPWKRMEEDTQGIHMHEQC